MKKPLLLCLLMTALASAAWTPPEKPDPEKILHEAEDAGPAQREEALAKFEWFHQNALKYDPALHGVRLSFALSSWADLAKTYPPALESMKKFRDLATETAKTGTDPKSAAGEAFSFDKYLNDRTHAVDFFVWLDANKPAIAKATFSDASSFLIADKKFDLCARYLDPQKAFNTAAWCFSLKETSVGFRQRTFIHDSAELVALLVITGKKADADTYAAKAQELLPGDRALAKALEEALKGTLPPEK